MLRKWLFLGLTMALGAVLAWLILAGRREEARRPNPYTEVLRESKPSATRVLFPTDLQIGESKMQLVQVAGAESKTGKAARSAVAKHRVRIRNSGSFPYRDLMLNISYLGPEGKILGAKDHLVTETVQPGNTIELQEFSIEDVPPNSRSCKVKIVYADFQ